jgi:hypothetical protein
VKFAGDSSAANDGHLIRLAESVQRNDRFTEKTSNTAGLDPLVHCHANRMIRMRVAQIWSHRPSEHICIESHLEAGHRRILLQPVVGDQDVQVP